MPADTSVDHSSNPVKGKPVWRRSPALSIFVLLAVFMIGVAAVTDGSANMADLIKIIAVVAFVGGMVALAMGMVGDAYRS